MARFPFSTLRGRLFLLVLLALIPALGLILFSAAEQRNFAESDARAEALRLARAIAADQEQVMDSGHQLLITLSHLPGVRITNPSSCNALFSELRKQYPQYSNLGVATPAGNVTCSAVYFNPPVTLSDLDNFQLALETDDVTVSNYQVDPITGRPSINFAYALKNAGGLPQSVIFATLDLNWLNQQVSQSPLPEEAVFIMIDGEGAVLMHRPDAKNWVGKSVPESQLVNVILAEGEGIREVEGVDGLTRLYAFAPLRSSSGTRFYVGVGLSKSDAFAEADRLLFRQLIWFSVVVLLAFAAAWFGSDIFILRRLRALLKATRRLERGDLSARTGMPYGQGEISELARAFDQMTAALELREKERMQAATYVARHNRDLSALNEAITAISSSLELPDIISNLKKQMIEQLDVPGGVIFFYDERDGSLYLDAAWGLPAAILADFKRFPASAYHYGRAIDEHIAILIEDICQATPYAKSGLPAARPNWRSYLCVPLLAKGEVLGVLDLFSNTPEAFAQEQVTLFTTLGQQVAVVIQNARLFSQVRAGSQSLQMLSQQLLEVQESERRHISRELHDEIGQALTAVKVNLQTVLRLSGASTNTRYLEESIAIIQRVLQQVRDLSLDLRPSLLDDLGVVAALRWYIDRQGLRAGFKTEFIAEPSDMRLPADMETVCFRVVQEALTNVVRHAVASRVQVKLIQNDNQLELVIRDDGIGFDVNAIRGRATGDTSLGLLGMQERVQLIGGHFQISSDPDQGTEIRALFRLPEVARPERGIV